METPYNFRMRAVLQRVKEAQVAIEGKVFSQISRGLLVFVAIGKADTARDADYLADKVKNLRIFDDARGKMNLSVLDVHGELLVVSQFTLLGDCVKGRRPSFDEAAEPKAAEELYHYFVNKLKENPLKTATGQFRAMMDVSLVNDGPVTFILDSRGKACLAPTKSHHD